MEMETFDALGQGIAQECSRHAESASGSTRVVKGGFDIGILGIDAQSARDLVRRSLHRGIMVVELRQRIEGDVAAVREYFGKFLVAVCRGIGMCRRPHLFVGKASLKERTGRGGRDILPHYGECLPQSESLERQNNIDAGAVFDRTDKRKVATEQLFVEDIAG